MSFPKRSMSGKRARVHTAVRRATAAAGVVAESGGRRGSEPPPDRVRRPARTPDEAKESRVAQVRRSRSPASLAPSLRTAPAAARDVTRNSTRRPASSPASASIASVLTEPGCCRYQVITCRVETTGACSIARSMKSVSWETTNRGSHGPAASTTERGKSIEKGIGAHRMSRKERAASRGHPAGQSKIRLRSSRQKRVAPQAIACSPSLEARVSRSGGRIGRGVVV